MIVSEELSASLDEPTDCLIMHRVEPTRLQLLALHLTDKLTQLADNNEQVRCFRFLGTFPRLVSKFQGFKLINPALFIFPRFSSPVLDAAIRAQVHGTDRGKSVQLQNSNNNVTLVARIR